MNNKFKNATKKPVNELERGDIILYKPLGAPEFERGIIYDVILQSNGTGNAAEFTILPIETISKHIKPTRPYPMIEKEARNIVKESGGTPGMHTTITQLHLKKVTNVGLITGSKTAKDISIIGSFAGSPFLVEILASVEELYKQGNLKKDSKPYVPSAHTYIVPKWVGTQAIADNSSLRKEAYRDLAENNQGNDETAIGDALKSSKERLNQEDTIQPPVQAAEDSLQANNVEPSSSNDGINDTIKDTETVHSPDAQEKQVISESDGDPSSFDVEINNVIQDIASQALLDMSLSAAVEQGYLTRLSVNFLADAIVPSTGKAPLTMAHAVELVENPDILRNTPGLRNGGKTFNGIIDQITKATNAVPQASMSPVTQDMTLEEAIKKQYLTQISVNFLVASIVPSTGKAPETVSHAFELVQNPNVLRQTPGLRNGGKTFKGIIDQVTAVETIIKQEPPKP